MRRIGLYLVLFLILYVIPGGICSSIETAPSISVLSIEGSVKIQRKDSNRWIQVSTDDLLYSGDIIKTGRDSLAILLIWDATTIRLDEDTELELSDLAPPEQGLIVNFKLFLGRIWADVEKLSGGKPFTFKVEDPSTSSLASVEGTSFEMSADGNEADITVLEGTVNFQNRGNRFQLKPLTGARTGKKGFIGRVRNIDPAKLTRWQKWNYYMDLQMKKIRKIGLKSFRNMSPEQKRKVLSEIKKVPNSKKFFLLKEWRKEYQKHLPNREPPKPVIDQEPVSLPKIPEY